MPTLRELTETIQRRPGVHSVVLLGSDGLVIETFDGGKGDAEALAAHAPGVVIAARQLGFAADAGNIQFAVLEFERGYGVIMRLSDQTLLFVSASQEVELSDLLLDIRRHRAPMAALV